MKARSPAAQVPSEPTASRAWAGDAQDPRSYESDELAFLRTGIYHSRVESWGIELRDTRVLDLAAGPGVWDLVLASHRPQSIVWHDCSPVYLESARLLHSSAGLTSVEYVLADILDLQYARASFDLVVCRLGLYYSANEWAALSSISSLIAPGGHFYIESPNYRCITKGSYRGAKWKYPLALVAPALGVLTHRKILPTPFQVEAFVSWWLRRRGFDQVWREESDSRTTFRVLWRAPTRPEDVA